MALLLDDEKRQKKKIIKIKRSLQKEEIEHNFEDCTSSEPEDVDFSKEIHPIGYYINDREQMIEQMFSIIKGNKLKKMLPPILKKNSLEELKADCVVHLLGMSKKRIFAILEGRDLNSSSDSETDGSNKSGSSTENVVNSTTHLKSDNDENDDTLDITISKNDLDSLIQDKHPKTLASKKHKEKFKKIKIEPNLIEISDDEIPQKKKKKEDKKSRKKLKQKRKHSKEKAEKNSTSESEEDLNENSDNSLDTKKGKSLLEILELEMRARAIRALLEKTNNSLEPVPVSVLDIKSETNSSTIKNDTNLKKEESIDDSVEVEIVNDNVNDDIIILDDTDEILETTENKTENESKNENVTWSQRWAESKIVKNVIQNNKICSNIKKRMRFARLLKQKKQQEELENQSKNSTIAEEMSKVEEGSVNQLELIKSLETTKKSEVQQNDSPNSEKMDSIESTEKERKIDGSENSNDINESLKISDVEIIEKDIEFHIDLTEL